MKKKGNVIRISLFIFFFAMFCFSSWQIILYFTDAKEADDLRNDMIENAIVSIDVPEPETSTDESSEEITKEEIDASFLKYPDISVDLLKIKNTYPDTVGWLYCPDTVIHYPVMQTSNNDYYVHRLADGRENPSGSLFMDANHSADLEGFCHVIYGHNMKNRSMFGSIREYRNQEYFDSHSYMFYFTKDGVFRLELFAGVHTVANSYYYHEPSGTDGRTEYISKAKSQSTFRSEVSVTTDDKILVLSTCSGAVGSDKRYVLMGKLVPLEF